VDDTCIASIVAGLRDPATESQTLGLRQAMAENVPIERVAAPVLELLAAPAGDVRFLAVHYLIQSARQSGTDLSPFLRPLEALFDDVERPSWAPWAGTVGEAAVSAAVLHWINAQRWDEIGALAQTDRQRMKMVLRSIPSSLRKIDVAPIRALLDTAHASADPELRGIAARVLAGYHAWASRWTDVESLLKSPDHATRCYAVCALDDAAEHELDVEPAIPCLLELLTHADADLEKEKNVPYAQTLRESAAGALVWHLLRTKPSVITGHEPAVVGGIDLEQIPELRVAIRELRKATPDDE
jgi:hypothetical protein